MNFIKTMDVVKQACQQFIQPHPCFYNFACQTGPQMAALPQLTIDRENILITGEQGKSNRINLHFIRNGSSQTCIIFLHGLASYCIEGKFIIPLLGDDLSLCLYDSRGHGRNSSNFVTYGLLQAQQLVEVINTVVAKGFKNIILWGRSMGAVTALRVLQKFGDHANVRKIKYVIADAPFVSFKKIAQEIVSQMTGLPLFLSGILSDVFASRIEQKYRIDLRQIDVSQIKTNIPVFFLYSSRDQLMGVNHIESIQKGFSGKKELIDTLVGHNDRRPAEVIMKVMAKIRNIIRRQKNQFDYIKKKGLSIMKKEERYEVVNLTMTPHCGNGKTLNQSKVFIPHSIGMIEIGKKSKQNIEREGLSITLIKGRQLFAEAYENSHSAKIKEELCFKKRKIVKLGSAQSMS